MPLHILTSNDDSEQVYMTKIPTGEQVEVFIKLVNVVNEGLAISFVNAAGDTVDPPSDIHVSMSGQNESETALSEAGGVLTDDNACLRVKFKDEEFITIGSRVSYSIHVNDQFVERPTSPPTIRSK